MARNDGEVQVKDENIRQKFMLYKLNEVQKRADVVFQKMRRMECANESGVVRCITCGRYHHYKQLDAGHYIPREHKGTRYEPDNVHGQCKYCNDKRSGKHAVYRDKLIEKIGKNRVEELERLKDTEHWQPRLNYRQHCIEVYIRSKNRIRELEQVVQPQD